MLPILSALIVAAAVIWSGLMIARGLKTRETDRGSATDLMALFAPGIAAAVHDPRALLAWQPLARMARTLYPREFDALDRAAGGTFPFSAEQIQQAHAKWTAEWLVWERSHDAECKLKTAVLEHELGDLLTTPYGRQRLDAIEREKLDRYQQRYEEYTRVARALQGLMTGP